MDFLQQLISGLQKKPITPQGVAGGVYKRGNKANTESLARQYAANPDSFTGSGIDPKIFGYPADTTARPPAYQYQPRKNPNAVSMGRYQGVDGYYPQETIDASGFSSAVPTQAAYDSGPYYQPASYNTGGYPHVPLQGSRMPQNGQTNPFGWQAGQQEDLLRRLIGF